MEIKVCWRSGSWKWTLAGASGVVAEGYPHLPAGVVTRLACDLVRAGGVTAAAQSALADGELRVIVEGEHSYA